MNIPVVISQSTEEPITLEEAARNFGADEDDASPSSFHDAAEIQRAIRDARQHCEQVLEMSLVAKVLEVSLPSWSSPRCRWITLPLGPVRSIVSVKYIDTEGADITLAADQYRLTVWLRESILIPAYGVSWPSARVDHDSIRVRYNVGYPSEDSPQEEVPGPIMRAMKLLINHFLENRTAVDDSKLAELDLGVKSLVSAFEQGIGV